MMKAIVTDKFSQNPQLQEKLLLTGTRTLIEATTDPYWGAGVIIGSKLLAKGKWKGSNHLGTILGEVRDELKRSEAWLGFQVPDSDDEPSIGSDSTTESVMTDSEVPTQSRSHDHVIDNQRLSSVTTRGMGSGSNKRKNKKKKNKREGRRTNETSYSVDMISSPGRKEQYRSISSSPPPPPSPTPTPIGGLGGARGRGRGRGSTPSRSSPVGGPQVGLSKNGHVTHDDGKSPQTSSPTPGHTSTSDL